MNKLRIWPARVTGCAAMLVASLVITPHRVWAHTEAQGHFGFENMTYLRGGEDSNGSSLSLSTLDGQINFESRGTYFISQAQAGLIVLPNFADVLPDVAQAYVGLAPSADTRFYLGRKKMPWSPLDSEWKLGIWQPRFTWDYLNPDVQGLIGAFYQYRHRGFHIMAFASPIFLPEQGAPIRNEHGEIKSYSPWNKPPPTEFSLGPHESTSLSYGIDAPPTSSIIDHPGAAVLVGIGNQKRGWWAQASYAFKPLNQVLLSADPSMEFSGPEPLAGASPDNAHASVSNTSSAAQAVIHPRVINEELAEMDFGYGGNVASAWMSFLATRPFLDSVPYKWISQEISPAFIWSPTWSWVVPRPGPQPTTLEISYMRSIGGSAPDHGQVANANYSYFPAIDPFSNAALMQFSGPIWWSVRQNLSFVTRTLYEFADHGVLLSFELQYRPARSWLIRLGSDVLGMVGSGAGSNSDNFFSRYEKNNRVRGAIEYVF